MKTAFVALRKHPLRWPKLPPDIRRGLESGTQRVEGIRQAVMESSIVGWMPLVEIVDVGWATNKAAIFGLAGISNSSGQNRLTVTLPASTIICVDSDAVLRSIIVHEFSHCFHLVSRILAAKDAGDTKLSDFFDRENDTEDGKRHVTASDWFGEEDTLMLSQDDELDEPTAAVLERWIERGLPLEEPIGRFSVRDVAIEQPIIDHVRRLAAR
jgi:hypothetical protein